MAAAGRESSTTHGEWSELADGVLVCRAEPDGVNIGLVLGDGEALLVDTGSGPDQGRELRRSAERFGRPLRTVVVTHRHRDHWFGLAAFADLVTVGHKTLAEVRPDDRDQAAALGLAADDLVPPGRTISTVLGLSVGGRWVEAVHLGRGHTDGDLVLTVPDAKLVFAGDLVESAGPPQFGPDADPRAWAGTVDHLVGLTMKGGWRAVPGHGEPMTSQQVLEQRARIGGIEVECRRLIEAGVPVEKAVDAGDWPFPADGLRHAVPAMYRSLTELGLRPDRTLPIAEV